MLACMIIRGKQISGSSELEKVLMRRRPDASGQVGSIKERSHVSQSSSTATDELAGHLRRRSLAIEEVITTHIVYTVFYVISLSPFLRILMSHDHCTFATLTCALSPHSL